MLEEITKIAIFRQKKIRKIIYKNEWWFSVIDVIEALTGTERPRKYWSDLKKKLINEGYSEVSEKIGQLKLEAPDGKHSKEISSKFKREVKKFTKDHEDVLKELANR